MCFSATASFAASGALTVSLVSAVRIKRRSLLMLALMPLLFAIQQAAEGLVWLTVASKQHTPLHHFGVYAFLAVALVVWPIWLPVSLLLAEQQPRRRRGLVLLVYAGVAVAVFAGWLLLSWDPVARVGGSSNGGRSPPCGASSPRS